MFEQGPGGKLVGKDKFGNEYYENRDIMYSEWDGSGGTAPTWG